MNSSQNTSAKSIEQHLISIIIPVYNKAEYVEDCIQSVVSQDFDNFEVIVVEDGSTDNSAEICDRLADEYPNVTVLHPENGGVTAARRIGLEQSKGEFITFVDADDKMLPGALRRLYDEILATGADEVVARYINQHDELRGHEGGQYMEPAWMTRQLLSATADFCVLWAVLFRRELLEGCLDTPRLIRSGEDILMQIECLRKEPKVWFSDEVVYMYNEGLPNDRPLSLDEQMLYDEILYKVFKDDIKEYAPYIVLHQTKMYENFLYHRQFSVFSKYYHLLRTADKSQLSLGDRIAVMLPPWLAYYPVAWKKRKHIMPTTPILCVIALLLCLSSCSIMKEAAKETLIESVVDSKTGAQVFTRANDTEPYSVNVGGIVKARKNYKNEKVKELIDKY